MDENDAPKVIVQIGANDSDVTINVQTIASAGSRGVEIEAQSPESIAAGNAAGVLPAYVDAEQARDDG